MRLLEVRDAVGRVWARGRVVGAFVIAPSIVALYLAWGAGSPVSAFVALSLIMIVISFLIGAPLFFLVFKRFGWLKLWQVTLAGALCALPLSRTGGAITHVELYGLVKGAEAFLFGSAVSFLFWWVAIFRNPQFEPRVTMLPRDWGFLAIVWIVLLFTYSNLVAPSYLNGTITDESVMLEGVPYRGVQLMDGTPVLARVPEGLTDPLVPDKEAFLASRRSGTLTGRIYWIISSGDAK